MSHVKVGSLVYLDEFLEQQIENHVCAHVTGHGNCLFIRHQLYAMLKGWA